MKARQALQNDVIKLTANLIFGRRKRAVSEEDKGGKQRLELLLSNKLRFMPHHGASEENSFIFRTILMRANNSFYF
jgi:hypothetical protein